MACILSSIHLSRRTFRSRPLDQPPGMNGANVQVAHRPPDSVNRPNVCRKSENSPPATAARKLSTDSFTAVGSMHTARFDQAAAFLPNGNVLISGGEDGSGNTLDTAEIYNP